MDLKTRAEEMRSFFGRKIDTYDEVHAAFAETKRLLTDCLPDGTETPSPFGDGLLVWWRRRDSNP